MKELSLVEVAIAPLGGVVNTLSFSDEEQAGIAGDDPQFLVDRDGYQVPPHGERLLSRWVATGGEVFGTWTEPDGSLSFGVTGQGGTTFICLTETHLRGSQMRGRVRPGTDASTVLELGDRYVFAIELAEIETILGSKKGVTVSTKLDGFGAFDYSSANDRWGYSVFGNKSAAFGAAVFDAVVAAKSAHPDPEVQIAAVRARESGASGRQLAGRRPVSIDFSA